MKMLLVLILGLWMYPGEIPSKSSMKEVELPVLKLIVRHHTKKLPQGSFSVTIDVLVQNAGSSEGWIDGRLMPQGHVRLTVRDSTGQIVKYPGWNMKIKVPPPADRSVFVGVLPGRVYGFLGFELCELFARGEYHIIAEYSTAGMDRYANEWAITLSAVASCESVLRL